MEESQCVVSLLNTLDMLQRVDSGKQGLLHDEIVGTLFDSSRASSHGLFIQNQENAEVIASGVMPVERTCIKEENKQVSCRLLVFLKHKNQVFLPPRC